MTQMRQMAQTTVAVCSGEGPTDTANDADSQDSFFRGIGVICGWLSGDRNRRRLQVTLYQTYQLFADRPTALELRALTVGQDYCFAIGTFDENGVSPASTPVCLD
jgi:hypothetical protein